MSSLLPANATPQETAIEAATARLADVATPLRDLWNPQTCPEPLLPWLAWALSVDAWATDWAPAQKRAAIAAAITVQRHKGTAGAVRSALVALGYPTTVIEWWQSTPAGSAYTFSVDVESDSGVDDATYQRVEAVAMAAKNARSHLTTIRVIARTRAQVFLAAAAVVGDDATVYPYSPGMLAANAVAAWFAVAITTETVTITPEAP